MFLISPRTVTTLGFPAWPNQLEVIRSQGTGCLPPCPCLFSSGAGASQLSWLSPAPGLGLPPTWSAFRGCCEQQSWPLAAGSMSHRAGLPRGGKIAPTGRVQREGGRGMRADQFWRDLLKCFVLALLLLSWRGWGGGCRRGVYFPLPRAELLLLRPARPVRTSGSSRQ